MAERELRKPAYVSLPAAVRAAILSGNSLSDIRLCAWADTYGCETEAIRIAWEAELGRQSQNPSNAFETPEGK